MKHRLMQFAAFTAIGCSLALLSFAVKSSVLAEGTIESADGAEVPEVAVTDDRAALQLTWPDGDRVTLPTDNWNITLLDSFDCETYEQVSQRTLTGNRILGDPVVNPETGNIAVAVLLEECVEVQKSAVFIVEPQGRETYALYRVQVPGDRPLPNEFSSYAMRSVSELHYWDATLLVRQGDASGAVVMLVFRPNDTPTGEYAGCAVLTPGEGEDALCP